MMSTQANNNKIKLKNVSMCVRVSEGHTYTLQGDGNGSLFFIIKYNI